MSTQRLVLSTLLMLSLLLRESNAQPELPPTQMHPVPPEGPPTLPAGPGYDGPALVTGEIPPDLNRSDEPESLLKGGSEEAGRLSAEFRGNPWFLSFTGGVYRPPEGERIDPLLVVRANTVGAPGRPEFTYAYVMFQGQITDERLARIRSLGVEPIRYHPNNSWAARVPLRRALELSALPEVRWVGYPRLDQKIDPALRRGIAEGWAIGSNPEVAGFVPVWINLYESDLNERSEKVLGRPPEEAGPGTGPRPGNSAAAGFTWKTNGRMEAELLEQGVRIERYSDEIAAYAAFIHPAAVEVLADREGVAYVEWRPSPRLAHDRTVPQLAQDYSREVTRVTTQTVGILDGGFHIQEFGGHLDLDKWVVGWGGGPCGGVFCYDNWADHGTHVMGTICGTGAADRAFRGMSPYVGSQSCAQRIYCAKLMYEQGYQYMRNPYVDPWGCTSSRPAVINNSWANDTCPNPPTPIRWTGSDASSRIIDAEVFTYNQLYVFAAGNQGDCSGPNTLGTIATPAAAKNVLGVACVLPGTGLEGDPGIAVYWSGRGPCGDGRWKPNVAAPGCEVTSTRANSRNGYVDNCGTSMAAPHVTGIMAGVAERYPEVRSNAALFRAWAMATAVTWQDASPTSGVSLPPTHLNSYGLGRISSIKAHEGGGSRPWTRTWSWGTVSSETDTFDFTVGSGVTRLMVVLAWDDPAAASGANPARVKDVDLYLDRAPFTPEGNTAEYGALSVVETVEHIVVNNPAAGSYRVKVYPYSTANTVRWGAMAIQLIGDTTPAGTLSATADRTYVVPGGAFNVNVTASSASYLATNLLLTQQNVGTQLLGTSTTLKDGVVLNNLHQTGTVTLGDVLSGDPRSITYTYRTISEGVVSVSYQARSDNWGTRNASTSVTVDGTAPPLVTSLQSTSHGIGTWSNTRNMTFTWSQSPDNVSGIAGYGEAFAGSSPVPVPATIVFGPATTRNVTAPSDSGALYFGLRAVDRAGNWNGGVSVGPYRIDTTLPTNPTNVVSSTHALNTWSNNPQINVTFTPASDSGSGLGGYAVIWDHSPTSVPTGTLVLPAGATSWSASVTGSAQGIWLHLRARDLAGNWGPTAHSGPYLVDTTPPGPVSVVIVGGPNATSLDVTLSLTAVDTHSGVAEMRFQNDGGSFSPWEPYAASRAWNLAHFGGSTATGSRAVRAEFRDRAGNGAGTSGSIYYYVPVSYFGSACDGSLGTPVFTIGGIPGIGRPIFFQVSNTAAPLGYLWMGLSAASWNGVPLPLELGPYGVPGCSINVSADILFHAGGLTANYTIADEPVLVGLVVYFQWVLVGDPSGRLVVTTRGAALTHSGR